MLLLFFRDPVNFHSPLFLDGWQSGWEFVAMLCESPFALDNTWKLIWDQKVSFVVTILTSVDKVSNKITVLIRLKTLTYNSQLHILVHHICLSHVKRCTKREYSFFIIIMNVHKMYVTAGPQNSRIFIK